MTSKLAVGVCLSLLLFMSLAVVVAALLKSHTIGGSGIIASQGMETNPTSIDWGLIDLNIPVSVSVTLTNVGTVALTSLHMEASNAVGLVSYWLSWDGEGKTINPSETLTVVFTLNVVEASGTVFSFDVVVSWI